MIAAEALDRVAAATVRLPGLGGQGVAVPGQMIVTAAHCVRWSGTGGMALGDFFVEAIESGDRKVVAQVYAAEPVADIAVLGALDDQSAPDEAEAFEAWYASVPSVSLCTTDFPLREPFPAWIRAHTGRWIEARAEQLVVQAASLFLRTREGIEGGTSGGPVVTEDGLLLGVISSGTTEIGLSRLHLAVPGHWLRTMLDPEWEPRAWRKYIRKHGMPKPHRMEAW
jgi:S1-C subfamily serine protease